MHRLAALSLLLCLAVLGAACAADEGAGDTDVGPAVPEQPQDGIGEDLTSEDAMEITGTLGGDAQLEGGCAWLDAQDGTRYEVSYPEGYEVARDGSELRGPDGEVVAVAGEEITVVGEVAEDMMSFCQVGTMFSASEVRS